MKDLVKPHKEFKKLLYELRVISNEMRQISHEKIINWIDDHSNLDGTIGKALTFVLPTRGCKYAMAKHGGCSMCTLPMDNPLEPSADFIQTLPQLTKKIFIQKGGADTFSAVKFYTSGSFLDRWELPSDVQQEFLRLFKNEVTEIILETRCEFVTTINIENLLRVCEPEKIVIAIGQETTDDEINRRSINKGHTLKQFERAVMKLKAYNLKVKGYILLKPIFLSEYAALEDAIRSASDMKELGVQNISINPAYIGKATLMDELYKYDHYRPPWLWTVYFVTLNIKQLFGSGVRVICDPVAAGSERGPKNCGECDDEFKSLLKSFSATQDTISLIEEVPNCSCRDIYLSSINTELLYNGMGVYREFPLKRWK
ncbi:MAG: archaeosine biosynthesis radical SAM protein RaSEA [Candidatus Heimdallarchaeota archaeon]